MRKDTIVRVSPELVSELKKIKDKHLKRDGVELSVPDSSRILVKELYELRERVPKKKEGNPWDFNLTRR